MLADGAWHHVAFVRERSTGRLYVDGVPIGARSYPEGPLEIGPHGLQLGQEQDCLAGCLDPDQALDGLFDEVTFYGRALSEAEILALVNAGSAGKCKPSPRAGDAVLVERIDALQTELEAFGNRLMDQEIRLDDMQTALEAMAAESGSVASEQCRHPGHDHRHPHHGGEEQGRAHRTRADEHPWR